MRLNGSLPSLSRDRDKLDLTFFGGAIDLEGGGGDSGLPKYSNQKYRRNASLASRLSRMLSPLFSSPGVSRVRQIWGFVLLLTVLFFILRWNIYVRPGVGSANQLGPLWGEPFPFPELKNLIMVAGHSVYTSKRAESANSEDAWHLEPYQRLAGQASTFVEHIKVGIEKVADDSKSLLLFSGGQTRKAAGPRTEAQSYWMVAEGADWFGHPEVQERALTEEHARDSFENLLFSLCRFRELTGHYPENVTVVSYDFKQRRFAELHRAAIGFPSHRFAFVGTPIVDAARKGAVEGEEKTLQFFRADPFGCRDQLLEKRRQRNPFARTIPYPARCPELRQLFLHCSASAFRGALPWASR